MASTIAITGRLLGDAPQAASPELALTARRILAAGARWRWDFDCAYAATVVFGDYIRPWFGVVRLNEDGGLVLNDPAYGERLDIPLDVSMYLWAT